MAEDWVPLPLDKGLYANLHPEAVVGYQTAIENGYVNDLNGQSRFPGMREIADFGGNSRIYLNDHNGDLIAGTDKGRIHRVTRDYAVAEIPGVPVSGGRRIIFQKTDRELLMAAGGPIVRLRDQACELLSKDAPLATHIGWMDDFTIAVELNSGRFYHSPPGKPDQWDPLDTFSADGNPDNINSLMITPFREIMLGGESSMEQFERNPTGSIPFFRRWSVGDGVKFPYVMLFADNALWTINALTEFVRFSGQTSAAASNEIGRLLEAIDDWSDAWLGGFPDRPLHIVGQKFMVLQAPNATNEYGTKGVTLLYDYKNKRFSTLYGWDEANGAPNRWPGWSHWTLWNKHFVGGEGKLYELDPNYFRHGNGLQRWLVRTAYIAEATDLQIKDFRLRIRRGLGTSQTAPTIRVRCSRDGRPYGPWITRSLGKAGDTLHFVYFGGFGLGSSFAFEISSADNCPIDLIKAEAQVDKVGH
jgi:hypothetical protein